MWKLASDPDVQDRMCVPSRTYARRSTILLDLPPPPKADPVVPSLIGNMGTMLANVSKNFDFQNLSNLFTNKIVSILSLLLDYKNGGVKYWEKVENIVVKATAN